MSEQINQEQWLLIDGDQVFSNALAAILESPAMAIELTISNSALSAIETLERGIKKFNTVIIDLDLTEQDAINLTALISDKYNIKNILVCSMNSRVHTIRQALLSGAKGFISKSQPPIAIINAIRKMSIERTQPSNMDHIRDIDNKDDSALSKPQLHILQLLKCGHANAEIADLLSVSHGTVKSHIRAMYGCLGAKNRMDCLSIAQRSGLL